MADPPGIVLRPARVEDAVEVRDLHVASIRQLCRDRYTPEQLDAWSRPNPLVDYQVAIRLNPFVVAEAVERIVGFGELDVERGQIKAVYVHPEHARRGVGRALLRELERVARARGVAALWLDSSLTAVPFYRSEGFRGSTESTHRLSSGGSMPCVRMRKDLSA